ncbi:MAG TPA: hypothetical protein VK698_15205 [Kofleriaceae bacterium]|nr:hypothetical protein [Kofleriaceae bacterium]
MRLIALDDDVAEAVDGDGAGAAGAAAAGLSGASGGDGACEWLELLPMGRGA